MSMHAGDSERRLRRIVPMLRRLVSLPDLFRCTPPDFMETSLGLGVTVDDEVGTGTRTQREPMTEFQLSDAHILFADEALLVIDKPPGVLSQPDATGDVDVVRAVEAWARQRGKRDPFVGLVHRLDRPASGVLLIARSKAAARDLSEQFRERLVEKQYLAVVEGRMQGIGTCTGYIAKIGRDPTLVTPDHPDGRRAVLRWQTVAAARGTTVVRVQLETGRSHQIRLQLSDLGHPIVGDFRYGATRELDGENLALHHTVLRFEHPTSRRMMTVTAAPPRSWQALLTDDQQAAIDSLIQRATPS